MGLTVGAIQYVTACCSVYRTTQVVFQVDVPSMSSFTVVARPIKSVAVLQACVAGFVGRRLGISRRVAGTDRNRSLKAYTKHSQLSSIQFVHFCRFVDALARYVLSTPPRTRNDPYALVTCVRNNRRWSSKCFSKIATACLLLHYPFKSHRVAISYWQAGSLPPSICLYSGVEKKTKFL